MYADMQVSFYQLTVVDICGKMYVYNFIQFLLDHLTLVSQELEGPSWHLHFWQIVRKYGVAWR